jgi:hypothetical protein
VDDTDVIIDDEAIAIFLTSPAGPVGDLLSDLGRKIYTVARNMAPISPKGSHGRAPGWLKTRIDWELRTDDGDLYVVVTSPALTNDGREAPYGKFQNIEDLHGAGGHKIRTTPHLLPAFHYVMDGL